jgi:predicted ATP-dependent endonuclease of OLD family
MSDKIYHKMPGTISGEDLTYLIYYDDRDRPLEIIVGEKAARKRYEDISVSWNAHLFVLIDNNAKDDKAPVALFAAEGKRVEELVQAGILEKSRSEGLETEITAIRTHLLARAEKAEAQLDAERDRAQQWHEAYDRALDDVATAKARAEAAEAEAKRLNTLLAIIFNDKQKALEMVEANQTAFNSARMDFIKLESEVKALREALEKIVKQSGWMLAEGPLIQSMAKTARAALDGSAKEES